MSSEERCIKVSIEPTTIGLLEFHKTVKIVIFSTYWIALIAPRKNVLLLSQSLSLQNLITIIDLCSIIKYTSDLKGQKKIAAQPGEVKNNSKA